MDVDLKSVVKRTTCKLMYCHFVKSVYCNIFNEGDGFNWLKVLNCRAEYHRHIPSMKHHRN